MDNKLLIDIWGWLTLYDQKEARHQEATQFYQQFPSQNGIIYTTDYILDEIFPSYLTSIKVYNKAYEY